MAAPSPLAGPAAPVPGRPARRSQAADDLSRLDRGLDRAALARVTAAVASLGAGMVALAVVGPFLRGQGAPLAPAAALPVVALAAWQLGWALAALRAVHLPWPRVATAVPAAAALGWLATAPALPQGPHTAHTSALLAALLGAVTCGAGVLARLGEHRATRSPAPVAVQVAVLLVVAFAVAAVVVPALAGSPAGDGAAGMAGMSGM